VLHHGCAKERTLQGCQHKCCPAVSSVSGHRWPDRFSFNLVRFLLGNNWESHRYGLILCLFVLQLQKEKNWTYFALGWCTNPGTSLLDLSLAFELALFSWNTQKPHNRDTISTPEAHKARQALVITVSHAAGSRLFPLYNQMTKVHQKRN